MRKGYNMGAENKDEKKETETWSSVNAVWKNLKKGCEHASMHYTGVVFHEEKYNDFLNLVKKNYNDIMTRFMKDDTKALDSHKQAAIFTICCLKANVIEHKLENSDKISIVPYMIALNVAISFMIDDMNRILKAKKIGKHIDQYYFPVAIACETPYEEIMCRLLYYEQKEEDLDFNILELSDRFFLLEYINLLQRGIEPYKLKDTN